MIFLLASGEYLVISPAGVVTIVYAKPYPLSGGIGVPQSLRTIANALDAAKEATAPLVIPGVCGGPS